MSSKQGKDKLTSVGNWLFLGAGKQLPRCQLIPSLYNRPFLVK